MVAAVRVQKMIRLLAILGVLLVGCSQALPSAGVSSSSKPASPASASAPTAPSNPAPAPTQSSLADLRVTSVDFACRMPVVTSVGGGDSVTFQGGFITFPAGKVMQDARGRIQTGTTDPDLATSATPVLHGSGGFPFYDRAQLRWVPAPAGQALADGSGYAYVSTKPYTNTSSVNVVDVASGKVRSFNVSTPERPVVADYGAAGVYLVSGSALGGPGQGVWLLDPGTGSVRQLREIGQIWAVRDGYAWAGRFDSRDKTVWQPMEIAPLNSLVRINLATGEETVWFYRAGTYPWFLGLDSRGRPIVSLAPNGVNEVRLIDYSGSAGQLVFSGNFSFGGHQIQGDGERLWFGGDRGLYLYRPKGGFQRVFAYDARPAEYGSIQPAGFCI
jgi:hypothetical protein